MIQCRRTYSPRGSKPAAQLVHPGLRIGIAGCTPITSRRQRTAGTDLWAVRHGPPLELTIPEKPHAEEFKPSGDRWEIVGNAFRGRDGLRPRSDAGIAPCVPGNVGDLARPEAEAA